MTQSSAQCWGHSSSGRHLLSKKKALSSNPSVTFDTHTKNVLPIKFQGDLEGGKAAFQPIFSHLP
jgi:hypothetical protein